MDIKEIHNLIRLVAKSGVAEVKYKTKDFEIDIKTVSAGGDAVAYLPQQPVVSQVVAPSPAAAPAQTPADTSAKTEAAADDNKYITVKAPMIGTFYRKPSPDKPVFVNVGDTIAVGDTVCVIEAMKLFNPIESDVAGKIVKILADDSSPVEYDQPLFLVDPA